MKAVLVISSRDNVGTALRALESGETFEAAGATVSVCEPVAAGHKVALRTIAAGEPVVKYGSPIGTATIEIAAGAHVHVHNVASSRGRGDLLPEDRDPLPRLAEPPDEASIRPNGGSTRQVKR